MDHSGPHAEQCPEYVSPLQPGFICGAATGMGSQWGCLQGHTAHFWLWTASPERTSNLNHRISLVLWAQWAQQDGKSLSWKNWKKTQHFGQVRYPLLLQRTLRNMWACFKPGTQLQLWADAAPLHLQISSFLSANHAVQYGRSSREKESQKSSLLWLVTVAIY